MKFLLVFLPSMLSLVALSVWLYPRWPRTKATWRDKVATVFTNSVREAIQKEVKSQAGSEIGSVAPAQGKEAAVASTSEGDINIIAKGTDKGIIFYTDKNAGCSMKLESSPSGAEVTLNGSVVGVTPVDLRGECKSTFTVKLSKKNYEIIEKTLIYSEAGSTWLRLHPSTAAPSQAKQGGLANPLERATSDMMDGEF